VRQYCTDNYRFETVVYAGEGDKDNTVNITIYVARRWWSEQKARQNVYILRCDMVLDQTFGSVSTAI
jgi:hypothetical protein